MSSRRKFVLPDAVCEQANFSTSEPGEEIDEVSFITTLGVSSRHVHLIARRNEFGWTLCYAGTPPKVSSPARALLRRVRARLADALLEKPHVTYSNTGEWRLLMGPEEGCRIPEEERTVPR